MRERPSSVERVISRGKPSMADGQHHVARVSNDSSRQARSRVGLATTSLAGAVAVLTYIAGYVPMTTAKSIVSGNRPCRAEVASRTRAGPWLVEAEVACQNQQRQASSTAEMPTTRGGVSGAGSARGWLVAQSTRGGAFRRRGRAAAAASAAARVAAEVSTADEAAREETGRDSVSPEVDHAIYSGSESDPRFHTREAAVRHGEERGDKEGDEERAQADGDTSVSSGDEADEKDTSLEAQASGGVTGGSHLAFYAGLTGSDDDDDASDDHNSSGHGGGEDESGKHESGDHESGDHDRDARGNDDHDSDDHDSDDHDDASDESHKPEPEEDLEQTDSREGQSKDSTAAPHAQVRPTAPLFSFPPGPRIERTEAEDSLQDVLPVQQRLVKYLTEDKVFGAQILCSLYFLVSSAAFMSDSQKFRGCYSSALVALTIKQWGTVLGRVRRVLVPHLLYEPQRLGKYKAKVAALALDPAVQGIIYCGVFTFLPLSNALLPLVLKEIVYLMWVVKEVLHILAPALVGKLTAWLEAPLSVVMTAGDVRKWRDTADSEKRLLLGRRLAQVCFKLEMAMPFSAALRVLPGVVQATLVSPPEGASSGGVRAQLSRMMPAVSFTVMMLAYVKLLTVRNGQLDDDLRVLRGLKVRGRNCEWVEQVADSVVFGKMVGCPWWVGLLASAFAVLPNHETTKTVVASDQKLKTMGMALLNLAIGRTPGAEEEEDDDEVDEERRRAEDDDEEASSPSKMAKFAKVAAVATGITDT